MKIEDVKVGDKVMVFDHRLFRNDKSTPSEMTHKPAEVLKIYKTYKHYEDVVDVRFDYDGSISKGHFVWGIEKEVEFQKMLDNTITF
jgi:hypothetical protein